MTTTNYSITGMTCDHCAATVSTALRAVPDITSVEVELGSGRVTVTSDEMPDPAAVEAAVTEAGYVMRR